MQRALNSDMICFLNSSKAALPPALIYLAAIHMSPNGLPQVSLQPRQLALNLQLMQFAPDVVITMEMLLFLCYTEEKGRVRWSGL